MRRPFVTLAAATMLVMTAFAQDSGTDLTGPAVGSAIPQFEAVDQNGKTRRFENLAGPNGLLLLFHRSADW